jgi:hypothetical protein
VVDPDVPVERSVKITLDPLQTLVLFAVKLGIRAHPSRLIASVLIEPEQPLELVSITVILPFLFPKLTVILLLLGPVAPEVMVEPSGTVQA